MALRERLIREGGMTGPLTDDVISNQQGFQDMKARLHRMLINRMDLTKLALLEPDQVHEEGARAPTHPPGPGRTAALHDRARAFDPRSAARALWSRTARAASRGHVDLRHSR